MISMPRSVSRWIRIPLSANSIWEAKVAWGHPSWAARNCPTWLASSSTACLPISTREGCSFWMTAASRRATFHGSIDPSCSINRARSAPIARAVRRSASPSAGEMLAAIISASGWVVSRMRRASSTAMASKGFNMKVNAEASISVASALRCNFWSGSGTRLQGTKIFMCRFVFLPLFYPLHDRSNCPALYGNAVESQRGPENQEHPNSDQPQWRRYHRWNGHPE